MEQELQNSEFYEIQFIDYLEGKLTNEQTLAFQAMLEHNEVMRKEFENTRLLWNDLNQSDVKVPSIALKSAFQDLLHNLKSENPQKEEFRTSGIFERIFAFFLASKVVFASCFLVFGTLIGYFLSGKANHEYVDNSIQVNRLSEEVREMKQMMLLAKLENPLATERMKAVSYTEDMTNVDDKVIAALITTFSFDENENVRLVALEALVKLAHHARVREVLISALIKEKSPLMQVALADAMLKLQEKKSIDPLKLRVKENTLNQYVKDKFEKTIKELSV